MADDDLSATRLDELGEGLLPGVEFDDAHAADDLVHRADALVGAPRRPHAQPREHAPQPTCVGFVVTWPCWFQFVCYSSVSMLVLVTRHFKPKPRAHFAGERRG